MSRSRSPIFLFAAILAIAAPAVYAQIGTPAGGGDTITWNVAVSGHSSIELRVSCAGDVQISKSFKGGQPVTLSIRDFPGRTVEDGSCSWEMYTVPFIPSGIAKQLSNARAVGNEKAAAKILRDAGIGSSYQSGGLYVQNGGFVSLSGTESNAARTPSTNASGTTTGVTSTTPGHRFDPVPNDQVIPDDLIVQQSLCVGFDCVNNESFGFDTIRLKENNTRIKFEDTSVGTFPTNDWQLTANDSSSGGSSKFSIEDITGVKVPFTITAGASTNSIFVDSTGRIGARTSTPVLDFHIATSNTPAIRLEQNNSGGFTAQTWDIAGNEANFFVRDVTSGSRLPFRIRPGAPTSSLDIAASGNVGIGTGSPASLLDVSGSNVPAIRLTNTSANSYSAYFAYESSTLKSWFQTIGSTYATTERQNDFELGSYAGDISLWPGNAQQVTFKSGGNVGIGTNAPTSDLVIANGATTSSINAGSAQFTVASSRSFKDNIEPVQAPDILQKIEAVPVVTYDFKNEGPKDRLGLIAEDFYTVFKRGDDKHIDGQDVQMALWLAVQQLTQENKALTERLSALEKELSTQNPQH